MVIEMNKLIQVQCWISLKKSNRMMKKVEIKITLTNLRILVLIMTFSLLSKIAMIHLQLWTFCLMNISVMKIMLLLNLMRTQFLLPIRLLMMIVL